MPRIVEIKKEDKLQFYWRGCFINNIPVDYVVNALHREQLYKGRLYFRYRQTVVSEPGYYKSGELCLGHCYVDRFYNQILSESSKNILSISNSNIIQVSGIPGRIKVHA